MLGSTAEVGQQYGAHIADVVSFIKLNKALFLNAVTNITGTDIRKFLIYDNKPEVD